jgi:hypothetical protein
MAELERSGDHTSRLAEIDGDLALAVRGRVRPCTMFSPISGA